MLFERVVVIGVGLIGGSFGLALKQAKLCGQVSGVGRNSGNLVAALEPVLKAERPDMVVGQGDTITTRFLNWHARPPFWPRQQSLHPHRRPRPKRSRNWRRRNSPGLLPAPFP